MGEREVTWQRPPAAVQCGSDGTNYQSFTPNNLIEV